MPVGITASMLYDIVLCPHRATLDVHGDPTKRDEVSPFVKLLWEKGTLFEREVISRLAVPFTDLGRFVGEEKERLTREAISRGDQLIYGGRLTSGDLVGEPDILRKQGDGYVAGDIKSGSGEEGPDDDPSPKSHYAVQLALYTDILEREGFSGARSAFIWDIHNREVTYPFDVPYGKRKPRTLWQDYEEALLNARRIIADPAATRAAYSSACKLCHWYSVCTAWLREADDLSLIPELGRSRRDAMIERIASVTDLARTNPTSLVVGNKTVFAGIGPDTLSKFHIRANLLVAENPTPLLRSPIQLPVFERELFFDIEVDPMRDVVYLHGFVERRNGDDSTERFVAFFADEVSEDAERRAFAGAISFVNSSRPCAIYYYSKYERTYYRKLQQKYPDVCSADDIEAMFDPAHAIDLLYDVVKKSTEWPTWDHSIKTLAKYLGFSWRDTHPSGAASIEWFDRWITEGDPAIKQRILDYNEDDCRATRVLLDGIRNL